jgi:trimethylamine:corrinoid methyltransferase-like protein
MSKELIEQLAKLIYRQWALNPNYVSWVEGGNSHNQDKARRIARQFFDDYQAAAPIDNVAEALEKAASIKVDYVVDQTDDPVRNKINGFINEAVETAINQYKQAIRSLIPDTQAKKGE